MHICPVCGYDRLTDPPLNFTICPSCGTEFGYDDAFASHAQLRAQWLRNGPRWWSPVDPRPDNWDPYLQVDAVASSLWHRLSEPAPSQQISTTLATTMNVLRQQPCLPITVPLGVAPKQTYTPQAA